MKKILLTGATDGIGLETAKALAAQGHHLLVHGRNPARLEALAHTLSGIEGSGPVESHQADFSCLSEAAAMARNVLERHGALDVLINNAGVLKTPVTVTPEGFDLRFVVNTFAPYVLTRRLLPVLGEDARVINVSSAAQNPVDLDAMAGGARYDRDLEAYAQSKLAITQWSRHMALELARQPGGGPVVVAVNPGSLLATKMVKEGFGMDGRDVNRGVDILVRAALSDEFAEVGGLYFDNDAGRFRPPHPDALDDEKRRAVVEVMEALLSNMGLLA